MVPIKLKHFIGIVFFLRVISKEIIFDANNRDYEKVGKISEISSTSVSWDFIALSNEHPSKGIDNIQKRQLAFRGQILNVNNSDSFMRKKKFFQS